MTEGRDPAFTAVAVTYNSAAVIAGLLDSLPAAVDGAAVETIVVDNDSTDGTAEVVAARGDCRLVRSANDGYAAGINRGVAAARGPGPVVVLNPDVRLRPGSIARLGAALRDDRVGIVVPRTLDASGELQFSLRREPSIGRELGLTFTRLPFLAETCNRRGDYAAAHAVDWATGAVMVVARACFDALGGFDESFFMYSEEVDFCLRARDRGWRTWYEPDAVVEHIGQVSGWNETLYAMQCVNRVRLYRRRHGPVRSGLFWSLALAAEAARSLRGDRAGRAAAVALAVPSRRPAQLGRPQRMLPR